MREKEIKKNEYQAFLVYLWIKRVSQFFLLFHIYDLGAENSDVRLRNIVNILFSAI
jgi:hypothetical protein